ncbi:MAG TPA: hypothetical protein V6D26_00025 [Stenomitos sp.]
MTKTKSILILASISVLVFAQKGDASNIVLAEQVDAMEAVTMVEFDPCGLEAVICDWELTVKDKIVMAAREAGYTDVSVVLAVSFCESSWNEKAVGKVDKRDRGVFQINSRWNPDVTDECAFDAECSTKWFINELNNNRLWKWKASQPCWEK